MDEDVFSPYPLLRFDHRLPKKWFHRFQHIYMWAMYPFLQLVFQYGDIRGLIEGKTEGCHIYGASTNEKISVVVGFTWVICLYVVMTVNYPLWIASSI